MTNSPDSLNNYNHIKNNDNLKKAFDDFVGSFKYWRIFYLIGIGDIRKRYARSSIGQFWLTLSLAINIATIGIIWSVLFKISIPDYLPYFATGFLFWQYISSCIMDGSNIYISSTGYLIGLSLPKLSYINSLFIKNIIILAHNLPVIVVTYLICMQKISISALFIALLGFICTSIFLFPITVILAIFSVRFRDFPNIIASIIQIVFYATPIMWKIELVAPRFHDYIFLNPLAIFLSLCRDSLLEITIPYQYWLAAICYISASWIVAILFFSKFRHRITYWL
ncbi:ABC transporter permease [Candidatus Trichorickettsia mobilis]|uniref:ABC transporter permease n=1 Tax=Candidatus Trichorickettsia mobilis TaxID=1346319 RepID=A0ABZ0UWL4_9RICK|nr:hypothetical protein [Candidatus Trichorickettsia mobilis]WPY00464.1 ABC transporter permease [Candidatus Trichorickettsia mobilis]